jgi:hypothetical protein
MIFAGQAPSIWLPFLMLGQFLVSFFQQTPFFPLNFSGFCDLIFFTFIPFFSPFVFLNFLIAKFFISCFYF